MHISFFMEDLLLNNSERERERERESINMLTIDYVNLYSWQHIDNTRYAWFYFFMEKNENFIVFEK